MSRDNREVIRQHSGRLGYLLNQKLERQAEQLNYHLQEFAKLGLSPLDKLVNYPLQRYNGRTPVHLAASNGLWECLEILLENGGNPNAVSSPTDLCQTPLHLAASKGFAKCLQILIEHNADMYVQNTHRETPLNLVQGKKQSEKVFQQAIARIQIPGRTREQEQRVEELHKQVEDGACWPEFYALFQQLPLEHMDLATRWTDWFQQTLLFRVCAVGAVEVVEFILSCSNSQPLHNLGTQDTPLLVACRKSSFKIVQLLLNHSPRLLFVQEIVHKLSAMHIACSRGDTRMVELILGHMRRLILDGEFYAEKELSLDFRDSLGRTPLFNACYYGYTDVVKLLIDFKREFEPIVTMNINAALNQTQRTPLHAAVRKGNLEIVKMLLADRSIDINHEARPSGRTHKRLIHSIMKRLHGRVIPMKDSIDEEGEYEESIMADVPQTPKSPNSPMFWAQIGSPRTTTQSSGSSGAIDEYISSPKRSSEFSHQRKSTPPSSSSHHKTRLTGTPELMRKLETSTAPDSKTSGPNVRNTMPSKMPAMKKQTSDELLASNIRSKFRSVTGDAVTLGETAVGIFENKHGRLELLPKDQASNCKTFDHIFMTALSEACAYGYGKIVSELLQNGARDESGLTSRIAHLIQEAELCQMVLSYHCVITDKHAEMNETGLELHWDSKKLPSIDGAMLQDGAIFCPPRREGDDGQMEAYARTDTGYSSRANRPRVNAPPPLPPIARKLPRTVEIDATKIRIIQLERNHLEAVPIELFSLPTVTEIDLSFNKITRLPENEMVDFYGWKCAFLEELNLSNNLLVKLNASVWQLPSLKKLNVCHNHLETLLPDRGREIREEMLSDSLDQLDFSHNELKALPQFVFEFKNVRRINLSNNKLETLPVTLWSCVSLAELNVSNNKLTSLPWCEPEITMITSRGEGGTGPPILIKQSEKVNFGKIEVRAKLNREASYFKKQQSVTVRDIKPIGTQQELSWSNYSTAGTEGCEYSSLIKLNLSSNRLEIFPEALPCLAPNLVELDVSSNLFKYIDIQFIPHTIKKFTAEGCILERFGNVLEKMLHSQVVKNCRHGKTFALPCQHRSHRRLPCLTGLHLSGNRLQYFQLLHHSPLETEGQNPAVDENRYYTNISTLELLYPVLEGLDLSHNDLRDEFNPNIGHHSHLKWIKLGRNKELEKIPMEFAHLKNTRQLTELSMDHLPNLREPPPEYQNVSLAHLLTYMRSRLKESVYYRTIKLFFIGSGERGKTTLLRRLRGLPEDRKVDRTTGIDIEDWTFPESKKFSFKQYKNPIHFLAWDFAGQDVYHTTHQCFYSRRSIYLALFRLSDELAGVNELEPWLRNVQLRAPGCPVLIVGTHLDLVSEQRARELQQAAMDKYMYDHSGIYPKIVTVVTICLVKRVLSLSSYIDRLRNQIYDVACHLQLSKDGSTLEYKPNLLETDPKALFQQQIPKSFLDLQDAIRQEVMKCHLEGRPPIMEAVLFRQTFGHIFEDEEELNEAVYCLNLQGTLLHFEDHGLRNVYFVDPQWLAKLMARVIHPSASDHGSPIQNGVAEVRELFSQGDIPHSLKEKYIHLLEKFEVALKINRRQVIIPSLMPETTVYPKTNDILSDITSTLSCSIDEHYHPPLRRFWLSNYIPDGFWPRLICRIATDQQIGKVLRTIIGDDPHSEEDAAGGDTKLLQSTASSSSSLALSRTYSSAAAAATGHHHADHHRADRDILNWIPWKTGIAFAYRGRTLLVLKQDANSVSDDFTQRWGQRFQLLRGTFRVELHVYTPEWIALANDLLTLERIHYSIDDPQCIPGFATHLLVMISNHIRNLATDWFPGMFLSAPLNQTFMPCWKCCAEIGSANIDSAATMGSFIARDMNPIHTFIFEDSIVPAALQGDLECPLHGKLRVIHVAPDLIFSDLGASLDDDRVPVEISEREVLGKGGFGIVCKGELVPEYGARRSVAVKVFLHELGDLADNSTVGELLEMSKEPRHLNFAYREIRQEVAFLSTLSHPHLTELVGVRTHPYMCLLLELAPKKSLRNLIKEYRDEGIVLEPLTLKNTVMQVASSLEYLHSHQVVHLDMKSPNVLVWHFPSPKDSRAQRLRQAGNVLIKIADYGISQVSTGLTLRVGNSPVGTPGFMAPEMFEHAGQEISSVKVDVFAFGMTLYELLSLRSPFDQIHQLKRNHEVRDKQRPLLRPRETRSLVLLQDLMMLCWSHDPADRPTMKQAKKWASASEFDRLRAEISLRDVKSISCTCVCRILPEYEDQYRGAKKARAKLSSLERGISEEDKEEDFDEDEIMDSVVRRYQYRDSEPCGGLNFSIGRDSGDEYDFSDTEEEVEDEVDARTASLRHNILPSVSEDTQNVEIRKGGGLGGGGGSPSREGDGGGGGGGGGENFQFVSQSHLSSGQDGDLHEHEFEPYTQIWLCGRDQRKGLLQIFTYYDGQPGSYTFSGYCTKDEISSICAVRNTMWMGTSSGTLKVFHAPTLKTTFAGRLIMADIENSIKSAILDILYVPETSSVLVANVKGEIWSFYDRIVPGGLKIQDRILLPDYSPCYHMAKVNVQGSIEVWGTMDDNRILLLEKTGDGWRKLEFLAKPQDPKLKLCSYIAHAHFTGRDGSPCNHIWISYRNRSVLVGWDANTRQQRCILNCADKLKTEDDCLFQVATLVAHGRKVFVGTSGGTVGIFDSESCDLLSSVVWHRGKVRSLLVMPREVEPCICAEVPFPKLEEGGEEEEGGGGELGRGGGGEKNNTQRLKLLTQLKKPLPHPKKDFGRGSSAFSFMDNRFFIPNPEPESVVITSIGNGRRRYVVQERSREAKLRLFEKDLQRASPSSSAGRGRRGERAAGDDVCLLSWKS